MNKVLNRIFGRSGKRTGAPLQAEETAAPIPFVRVHEDAEADCIVFSDVSLLGPGNQPLVDYGSVTYVPGDRVMLSGRHGCGKSAGLAAMRNAWLLGGTGDITVPTQFRFVPQEDYFPDRSLRGIICAPDPVSRYTNEQVEQALTDAGLGAFIPEMDDPEKRGEYWKNTLSGGQKNKIGFAGAFLHAATTKVLVLDEVTAALDAESETELYPKLLDRMKHGIVISIAHHTYLASMHNVFTHIANGKATHTRGGMPAELMALPAGVTEAEVQSAPPLAPA